VLAFSFVNKKKICRFFYLRAAPMGFLAFSCLRCCLTSLPTSALSTEFRAAMSPLAMAASRSNQADVVVFIEMEMSFAAFSSLKVTSSPSGSWRMDLAWKSILMGLLLPDEYMKECCQFVVKSVVHYSKISLFYLAQSWSFRPPSRCCWSGVGTPLSGGGLSRAPRSSWTPRCPGSPTRQAGTPCSSWILDSGKIIVRKKKFRVLLLGKILV